MKDSPAKPYFVRLVQCGRRACSHVLTEDEYKWVPDGIGKCATCPLCGFDDFWTLNAAGQKMKFSQLSHGPVEIDPASINPSPRMGPKMKAALLDAKKRAIAHAENLSK